MRTYHGVHVDLTHLLDEFDGGTLAVLLVELRIGLDEFVGELSHGLLQSAVTVAVVGRLESFANPGSLGVGDGREGTGSREEVLGFLTFDGTDDVSTVLVENFGSVHSKERFSSICERQNMSDDLVEGVVAKERCSS